MRLALVSAPEHSPDFVTAILESPTGLRGWANMQLLHEDGYASAELDSFDRVGRGVRYELPFGGVVRAASSAEASVRACGLDLLLDAAQMAELRLMALLAIYRRRQVDPTLPLPARSPVPTSAPSGELEPPLRASAAVGHQTTLTFVYDSSHPDRLGL